MNGFCVRWSCELYLDLRLLTCTRACKEGSKQRPVHLTAVWGALNYN